MPQTNQSENTAPKDPSAQQVNSKNSSETPTVEFEPDRPNITAKHEAVTEQPEEPSSVSTTSFTDSGVQTSLIIGGIVIGVTGLTVAIAKIFGIKLAL